jgi:NAD(P)-dependent dehydrogenase (short-subunit alcohol dehydrogenase family)
MIDTGVPRVVVLTGGARAGGMGRAIAESFLRLGDVVVLSDVGQPLSSHPDYEVAPPSHLEQAASELADLGPVLPVACDVTDEAQVVALFDRAVADHGSLR